MGADHAVRVSIPRVWAEAAGAALLDLLGPYQEMEEGEWAHLIFYPFRHGSGYVPDEEIYAAVPGHDELQAALSIERLLVPGGWKDSWKRYFVGVTVGRLHIRPPWEEAPRGEARGEGGLLDIVLTPGLAFGTGLHPTTRGVLELMQKGMTEGSLVDAGTGSGILSIAAVMLGFAPVHAFDHDPLSVEAAKANAAANGVEFSVEGGEVDTVPLDRCEGGTILANITVEPVLEMLSRLARERCLPRRAVVSGILEGSQTERVLEAAGAAGLQVRDSIVSEGWSSMDLTSGDGR